MGDRGENLKTNPRIELGEGLLAAIREHGARAYPEEACGGLLGRVRDDAAVQVRRVEAVENSRREGRRRRYLIEPDEVLALERRADSAGLDVVGYYHSHPDAPAHPSDFDRDHAWPWYVYLIVGVLDGRAGDTRAWRLAHDRRSFERVPIEAGEPNE